MMALLCGDICDFCVNFLRGIGGRSHWWKVLSYEFTFAFALYIHQTILWRWWCAFEDANPLSVFSHTSHAPPSWQTSRLRCFLEVRLSLSQTLSMLPNYLNIIHLISRIIPERMYRYERQPLELEHSCWTIIVQKWLLFSAAFHWRISELPTTNHTTSAL